MITQTIVPTIPVTTPKSPRAPLVSRLVERIVHFHWPHQTSIDAELARAIDEAFESLARESRS